MPTENGEPTIGELVSTLATNTATLVKQEVQLASTEMAQKTSRALGAAGMVGMGGAILHVGALVLSIALILALQPIVPMWISALVLGALVTGTGAMMLVKGLGTLRRLDVVPRKTLQTLETDVVWAKEQVR